MSNMIKNLTGQRFGMLLAIEATKERKNGGVVWKCLCDCGKICYVTSGNLQVKNHIKSCGCYKYNRISENRQAKICAKCNEEKILINFHLIKAKKINIPNLI